MKWYAYLVCFILVTAGVFFGIRLYFLVTAESYINGTIAVENRFSIENFSYANTTVEFSHDIYDASDLYVYSVDLQKVNDFNGQTGEYQIVLNGYLLTDVLITAGAVSVRAYIDFYDTGGELSCSTTLTLSVVFLSDKTTLTLSATGGREAGFLTQYFRNNGIRFRINKIMKGVN